MGKVEAPAMTSTVMILMVHSESPLKVDPQAYMPEALIPAVEPCSPKPRPEDLPEGISWEKLNLKPHKTHQTQNSSFFALAPSTGPTTKKVIVLEI